MQSERLESSHYFHIFSSLCQDPVDVKLCEVMSLKQRKKAIAKFAFPSISIQKTELPLRMGRFHHTCGPWRGETWWDETMRHILLWDLSGTRCDPFGEAQQWCRTTWGSVPHATRTEVKDSRILQRSSFKSSKSSKYLRWRSFMEHL